MNMQTTGTVVSAAKQWWFKINSRPARALGTDGAIHPYVIKVSYSVNGREYTKRKWIHAGQPVPALGSSVQLAYCSDKPSKAKLL